MNSFLLDTHVVIWALTENHRLDENVKAIIKDPGNSVYFSAVSLWEIAIKNTKAPDKCPYNEKYIYEACIASGFELLELEAKHIFGLRSLSAKEGCSLSNMDPFDRILISQAKTEDISIISADSAFKYYDESCIITL